MVAARVMRKEPVDVCRHFKEFLTYHVADDLVVPINGGRTGALERHMNSSTRSLTTEPGYFLLIGINGELSVLFGSRFALKSESYKRSCLALSHLGIGIHTEKRFRRIIDVKPQQPQFIRNKTFFFDYQSSVV